MLSLALALPVHARRRMPPALGPPEDQWSLDESFPEGLFHLEYSTASFRGEFEAMHWLEMAMMIVLASRGPLELAASDALELEAPKEMPEVSFF